MSKKPTQPILKESSEPSRAPSCLGRKGGIRDIPVLGCGMDFYIHRLASPRAKWRIVLEQVIHFSLVRLVDSQARDLKTKRDDVCTVSEISERGI